ncbi:MAG: 30S ribosomal protein S17e [Candidatus Hydrothermarchaeales archaeon]
MGRIRHSYIKRTALEAIKRHGDEFTVDFADNRALLDKYVDVQGKFLKNKIAGYITHLLSKKKHG